MFVQVQAEYWVWENEEGTWSLLIIFSELPPRPVRSSLHFCQVFPINVPCPGPQPSWVPGPLSYTPGMLLLWSMITLTPCASAHQAMAILQICSFAWIFVCLILLRHWSSWSLLTPEYKSSPDRPLGCAGLGWPAASGWAGQSEAAVRAQSSGIQGHSDEHITRLLGIQIIQLRVCEHSKLVKLKS